MRNLVIGCAVAAAVGFSVNSDVPSPKILAPRPCSLAVPLPPVHQEVGLASWYGQELQGSETTSGEPFDMNALTAAHRKLPLGTRIWVTNLRNHRSVIVRVNDRGPNVAGRLLDVSKAAADRLGFRGAGIAKVRIRTLSRPQWYVAQGIDSSTLRPPRCPVNR
jgi:rare lipoprotein A